RPAIKADGGRGTVEDLDVVGVERGAAIPPADFIRPAGGSLLNNLTARVALATTTSPLLTGCGSASVVDLVGYGSAAVCFEGAGAAPGLGAVDGALLRKSSGAQ
ncbi:MAG: hypothetical protein ACK462_12170, partial [Planctomyces sp.]